MREIAILNLTRFGDLVQTSPVLVGLRKRHPDARIHLIVKSRFRSVAELLPCVDAIHEIDGEALARCLADPELPFLDAYRRVRGVVDALAELRFDWLVNFTHSKSSAVLLALMNARRVTGFSIDREGRRIVADPWLRHMATLVRTRRVSHLNLVDAYLGSVGLAGCGERLAVRVSERARGIARERLPSGVPRVGVQLGASAGNKTWSVERYAAALGELTRLVPDVRIALVGVDAERERAAELRARSTGVAFEDLVGKTKIEELAAALERLDLLLTNDTGTMHLAGAVGTPTCAVFVGPGYPFETAVYAEGHHTLHSRVACAPCNHFIECGHPVCHGDVPTEWLGRLAAQLLRGHVDVPALPRADLQRTAFDEEGLLDLVPLHRRAAAPQDLMALAQRAAFVESFTRVPARPETVWRRAEARFGAAPGGWARLLPAEIPLRLETLCALARSATRSGAPRRRSTRSRGPSRCWRRSDTRWRTISRPSRRPTSRRWRAKARSITRRSRGAWPCCASSWARSQVPPHRSEGMIELHVNGRSTGVEPASIPDLRAMVGRALPSDHVVCAMRVNGREVPESSLEELELRAIQRLEVKSATPRDLAYQALGETGEWIGRICDVLQSVARDYRLGRDKDAHGRMAAVADALQVLAGLLQGIWAFVDSDPGVRGRLEQPWSEAEAGLRRSIEGLIEDMESGDPVRLADHAGYLLPRSLERFRDILGRIAR